MVSLIGSKIVTNSLSYMKPALEYHQMIKFLYKQNETSSVLCLFFPSNNQEVPSFEILHLLPHSLLLSFTAVNYSLKFLSPPTLSPFFSVFLYVSLRVIFCNLSFPIKSCFFPSGISVSFLSAFSKPSPALFFNFLHLDFPKFNRNWLPTDWLYSFSALFQLKNNKMEDHFAPEFLVVLLETHLQSSTHNGLYELWQFNK